MEIKRYPSLSNRGAVRTALILGALAGCSRPDTAANNVPSTAPNSLASTTPSSPEAAAVATVCEGFFTLKRPDNSVWVVGRPVVDSNGIPQDVEAHTTDVRVAPRPVGEGVTTWYTLQGEPVPKSDVPCQDNVELYPKQIHAPNGDVRAATTNPQGTDPSFLDWQALDPDGAAVAGLDYGDMSPGDLDEILFRASQG